MGALVHPVMEAMVILKMSIDCYFLCNNKLAVHLFRILHTMIGRSKSGVSSCGGNSLFKRIGAVLLVV